MKHFYIKLILMFLFLGAVSHSNAQTTQYQVWVYGTQFQHNYQCCDDAAGTGCCWYCIKNAPEPVWNLRSNFNGGAYSATSCIQNGTQDCGTWDPADYTINTGTGFTTLPSIQVQLETWEDDQGGICSYDPGCCNADNNYTAMANYLAISSTTLSAASPCTVTDAGWGPFWSGGYAARIAYQWRFTQIDPGSISAPGSTTGCSPFSPGTIGNSNSGTEGLFSGNWTTLQWEQSVNGGAWTNVSGATGLTYTPTGLTIISGATTTYAFRRRISASCGSATSQVTNTITITVHPTPSTPTAYSNQTRCGTGTFTFTSAPGASGTEVQWSENGFSSVAGTGNTYTTSTVSAGSSITVSARTRNATTGCLSSVISATATANTPPTASAGSPQTVCAGGTITLAGTRGGSATSSTWSAPSGTFSNTGSLTSTYTPSITSGLVTLTLTTNDPDGAGPCIAAVSTVDITVNPAATASAGTPQTVCAGGTITLAGSRGGSATSSTWSAPSGSFSNSASLTSTYTPSITSGTVLLTLTTNDPDGAGPCNAAVSTVLITVNPAATANAGTPQVVCAGGTITLAGTRGGSATSSTWSAPSGSFSNTGSLTSTYTPSISNGTVTLTLTTNDPDGAGPCSAAVSTVIITVNPRPNAATIATTNSSCDGGKVLTLTATGGTSPYNFTITDGTTTTSYSGVTSPFTTVPPAVNKTYTITAVTDANTCAVNVPIEASGSAVIPNPDITSGDCSITCSIADGTTKSVYDGSGKLMVTVSDASNGVSLGSTTVCVTVDGSVNNTNDDYYLQRHFSISPTTNTNATVCLYIPDSEIANFNANNDVDDDLLSDLSNLCIMKYNGGAETPFDYDTLASTQIISSALTITPNTPVAGVNRVCFDVSSFSSFFCFPCNTEFSNLPVDLVYFVANGLTNTIELSWQTASEKNNKEFEILRSTDGKSFSKIGVVQGNGNSSVPLNYTFTDKDVKAGVIYYYQLKQVDFDGQSSKSRIASAMIGEVKTMVVGNITPNPSKGNFNVPVFMPSEERLTLQVFSIDGKLMQAEYIGAVKGMNMLSLDYSALPSASYLLVIQSEKETITQKIIIEK